MSRSSATSCSNWYTARVPPAEPVLLYADDALLVIEKPAGLLSVPGRGPDKQDCLSARIQARFSDALVVHRLDMATSGLMVLARGTTAQQRLNLAFAQRRVHKRYQAIVQGTPASGLAADAWATIDLPILLDWPQRPRRIISTDAGKPSMTRWRVAGSAGAGCTRVDLEPVTGRSHQLRVHMLAIGHPILGDALYQLADSHAAAPRLLLHATRLSLDHPMTGVPMVFSSTPPFQAP